MHSHNVYWNNMEHSGIIRNQSLYTTGGKAPLPTPQYANVSSVVGAVNNNNNNNILA